MSRMLHTSLVGKLEVHQEGDSHFVLTIGGYNVIDELLLLEGQEVHLEAIAYEGGAPQTNKPQSGPYQVPDESFIKKLMGDDGSTDS